MGYSKGNAKLGSNIYTYSRLAGQTCPGASNYCASVCYAKKIQKRWPNVEQAWGSNSVSNIVLYPPSKSKVIRMHVSGDFDSSAYIQEWVKVARAHPDKVFFGYTRSWKIPYLINWLELLRSLKNVQLFASVDSSMSGQPPSGWRIAYIDNITHTSSHVATLKCPEQEGTKASCQECKYCFVGRKGNVLFKEH